MSALQITTAAGADAPSWLNKGGCRHRLIVITAADFARFWRGWRRGFLGLILPFVGDNGPKVRFADL